MAASGVDLDLFRMVTVRCTWKEQAQYWPSMR